MIAVFSKSAFAKDLLASVDRTNPTFYSDFSWRKFYEAASDTLGLSPNWFSDPDALLFVDEEN